MYKLTALRRSLSLLSIAAALAGCSTLSRDGPTGSAVERESTSADRVGSYTILDLDLNLTERIKATPKSYLGSLAGGSSDISENVIGTGDGLTISIFEPGGALFGAGIGGTTTRSGTQLLPNIVVDSTGRVTVPFAGPVRVAGLTPAQAAEAIRQAFLGKISNPQILVEVSENTYNTVTILGEVRQPGRAALTPNSNRVVDLIASRGGSARAPEDLVVTVNRRGQVFSAPMTVVTGDFEENIRLERGDQVNVVLKPRRFSTFGALGDVSQVEMGAGPLNLSGALSKVGGLDAESANARSVLVFRFERPEVASALGVRQPPTVRGVPVVYRLNLEDPADFFVANDFQIQGEDIVYVPRSGSAELGKFFTLVRTLTNVVYDISVANTLGNN